MGDIDVSIILINYKTQDLLHNCIESIYRETKGITFEVIVIENDTENKSGERICAKFPEVRYIEMGYNSGFGRANNKGIRESKGNYILVLNDDTEILENAIKTTFDYYVQQEKENAPVGYLTCKICSPDGTLQFSSNDWFLRINDFFRSNPLFLFFNRKSSATRGKRPKQVVEKYNHPHEAKWVSGAYLFFNADLYRKHGLLFDEDFLIYTEDMDICYRGKKLGYKMLYSPASKISHINSASYSEDRKSGQLMISEWLYILKRNGSLGFIWLLFILYFGIFCESALYFKNKILGRLTDADRQAALSRKFQHKTLNRYGLKILFNFKRKPSSAKNFLKYTA